MLPNTEAPASSQAAEERKLRFFDQEMAKSASTDSDPGANLKRRSTAAPALTSASASFMMGNEAFSDSKILRRSVTSAIPSPAGTVAPLPGTRSIRVVTKASDFSVKPRRRNLKALSGMRTLATFWIVLGHFQQTAHYYGSETFVLVLGRGYIPVAMYIILSGFVTHYAYKKKVYSTWPEVGAFYTRRLCRVLFTYYVSIILGLLDPLFTNHDALASDYPQETVATIFLIQSWFELPRNENWDRDIPSQPNPAGWTISTLLVAWILYPLMNSFMKHFNRWTGEKVRYKLAFCTLLYLLAMTPWFIIYFGVFDRSMRNAEFELLYKFPPLRLADFGLGVVLAELVDHPGCNSWTKLWRVLPDLSLVAFSVIVLVVNPDGVIPMTRDGMESFFISGLCPLLGIMLLGYSINSDKKLRWSFSALLEHRLLLELGNWSFAIYCFQYTFFFMFEKWQDVQTGKQFVEDGEEKLVAPWLLPYLLALYGFSAFWTEVFEKPFAKYVKIWTAKIFSSTQQNQEARKLVVGSRTGSSGGNLTPNENEQQPQSLELGKSSLGSIPSAENMFVHNSQPGPPVPLPMSPTAGSMSGRSKYGSLTRGTSQYRLTRSQSSMKASSAGPQPFFLVATPAILEESSQGGSPSSASSSLNGSSRNLGLPQNAVSIELSDTRSPHTEEGNGSSTQAVPKDPSQRGIGPPQNALSLEISQDDGEQDEDNQTRRPSQILEQEYGMHDAEESHVEDGGEVHVEFAIEDDSESAYSERYESDPEYEKGRSSDYDYIPDTDDEGDIEVDEDAMNFMNSIIDSALTQEIAASQVSTEPPPSDDSQVYYEASQQQHVPESSTP